jgi:hypothetical protein
MFGTQSERGENEDESEKERVREKDIPAYAAKR